MKNCLLLSLLVCVASNDKSAVFAFNVESGADADLAVLETTLQLASPRLVTPTNLCAATSCSCDKLRSNCSRFPPDSLALAGDLIHADYSGVVFVDGNGDLSFTPLAGRTVLVQGVDVPASLSIVDRKLGKLEDTMQIAANPIPELPARSNFTNSATVGHDPLGNLLLIPKPNRTLVMAGMRVLELLTHVGQRLAVVEERIFGPGAAPNVTSAPRPSTSLLTPPGTVGLDAAGNVRMEPVVGKAVLAAGRNMVLELHQITVRLNLTESAMAACPCLAPPSTCRPAPDCHEDLDECISLLHSCHTNSTCTNTAGSFTCACNHGFTGNGVICSDVDECATNNGGCNAFADCNNTPGSRTCACKSGFTGSGTDCANVNECSLSSHNCHTNATCIDTAGSFTCTCNPGSTGSGVTCALPPFPGGLRVSGAGSAMVNGDYIWCDMMNEKPVYCHIDANSPTGFDGHKGTINWRSDGNGQRWGLVGQGGWFYNVFSTSNIPPTSGWSPLAVGASPAPTISFP